MQNKRYSLKVRKTNAHMYVTCYDDVLKKTLVSESTLSLGFKQANVENCYKVGLEIGKKVKKLKIDSIWFDRNQYRYHGRIDSLAKGARESGCKF